MTTFKPHKYQISGMEHALNNNAVGLFLDMGLGKTVMSLTVFSIVSLIDVRKALIIAPKKVIEDTWTSEIEKWEHLKGIKYSLIAGSQKQRTEAYKAEADIYLVSRDNLVWLIDQYGGSSLPYDMLIIDELSSFKSPQSARFKALRKVRPKIKRVIGLTGTPTPKGLIDLWSQLYLLDGGERLGSTITGYRAKYFTPASQKGHIVYSYALKKGSSDTITDKIKDICVSMSAKDYLDMPKRIDNFISVQLDKDVAAKYKDFEKHHVLQLFEDSDKLTAVNIAVLANKLLQFANGAVYDENKTPQLVHDAKLDRLEELVEVSNGKPMFVAWNFKHDLARILKRLEKYNCRELRTRQDIADWNSGKIEVLLAHPLSVAYGLNLQYGGSTIVWFGLNWSLELYLQLNARIYRQGQKETVIVHHLITKGTIDERVMKVLTNREATQNSFLDIIKDI